MTDEINIPLAFAKKLQEPETSAEENYFISGLDLYNRDFTNIPMLVGKIIPKKGLWTLVGSSDTGKSMILRQMAICVATNSEFLEWNVFPEHKKVIFVSTEDDDRATTFLLKKQTDLSPDLQNIWFYFNTENIPEFLERELENEPRDLIIIDAWSDVFGQDLKDSALIRHTLNRYNKIADKYNCSIGFLHHTGKRTEKLVPSKNNILSGQGFEAKMRLVIELRNDNFDENKKHFCIVKGNYLPKDYKDRSFVLTFDNENFTFTNTLERVYFEDLATVTDSGKEKKPAVNTESLDTNDHYRILQDIFKVKELKLAELKDRISTYYGRYFKTDIGERKTGKIFSLLTTDLELIKDNGEKDRSPKKRYYLTTDNVTNDV